MLLFWVLPKMADCRTQDVKNYAVKMHGDNKMRINRLLASALLIRNPGNPGLLMQHQISPLKLTRLHKFILHLSKEFSFRMRTLGTIQD